MKKLVAASILVLGMAASAHAIPELQLYIEGSTYGGSETWITSDSTFKLWVIGDLGKPKTDGSIDAKPISHVSLSVAYKDGETGTITLTPTTATTGLLPAPGDPSTPSAPTISGSGSGTQPLLSDGTSLSSHGIYGSGTNWMSYLLGDFTLTDSPIGDFITSFPTSFPDLGQINVYDVTVSGFESGVHFDTYNTVEGATHATNAPFSHDAEGGGDDGGGGGGGGQVPEPSTILLLGAGLMGLGLYGRKRIQK